MIFSGLFKKRTQKTNTATSNIPDSSTTTDVKPSAGINADSGIQEIDDELVAVITAAIQSSLSYDPHSQLVIKSITRTGQNFTYLEQNRTVGKNE